VIKVSRMRRGRGFTLIEVMVALTIFSAIAVSIGACVMSGLRIWNNIKNVNFAKANFILDMDRVAGELRRTIDIPEIGFEGKSLEVSFPFVDGKNAVVRLAYLYDPEKKALFRKVTTLRAILDKKDDKEYSEEEFMQLEDFLVTYFDFDKEKEAYLWDKEWTKDQGPFRAVKLEGKFKGESFVKTVFIPISS